MMLTGCCLAGCALKPYEYGGKYHTDLDRPLLAGEPQFERGSTRPFIDGIARVLGTPKRLLLLKWNVDNHDISEETESELQDYLAKNGLEKVKVQINEYDPCGEWRRLKENQSICAPMSYTFGTLYMAGYTLLPGRVWGGDDYCLWTNTIHLYSDVPELALYQGGKAKACAKREHKWFGKGNFQAMQDALAYIHENHTPEELRDAYVCLYPTVVTQCVPLWSSITLPAIGAGHVAGRIMALSIHDEDFHPQSEASKFTSDPAQEVVRLPSTESSAATMTSYQEEAGPVGR